MANKKICVGFDLPNETTLAAIEEGDKILSDSNRESSKTVEDLRKALDVNVFADIKQGLEEAIAYNKGELDCRVTVRSNDMEVIRKERKLCLCCMEEHDVSYVRVKEKNIFRGQEIEYEAMYEYCDKANEYIASDDMISANNISLKNAYRKKVGLLAADENK